MRLGGIDNREGFKRGYDEGFRLCKTYHLIQIFMTCSLLMRH